MAYIEPCAINENISSFKTSDGDWRKESAVITKSDDPEIEDVIEITGSFGYTDTDSFEVIASYKSGVDGHSETREKNTPS